jgi:hypothetical protein
LDDTTPRSLSHCQNVCTTGAAAALLVVLVTEKRLCRVVSWSEEMDSWWKKGIKFLKGFEGESEVCSH